MQRYYFSMHLTVEQCQGYYSGAIRYVVVKADSGQRVQLLFRHFQPFVSAIGIRGRFRLTTEESGRFVSLEKIN